MYNMNVGNLNKSQSETRKISDEAKITIHIHESDEELQQFHHAAIVGDVSSNFFYEIPMAERSKYAEELINGVPVGVSMIGQLGQNEVVAVSGLSSCGAAIFMGPHGHYYAIHVSGEVTAIQYAAARIKTWLSNHSHHLHNDEKFTVVFATGPDGDSEYVLGSLKDSIPEILKGYPVNVHIYRAPKNQNDRRVGGQIAVLNTGEVGFPPARPLPRNLPKHRRCIVS